MDWPDTPTRTLVSAGPESGHFVTLGSLLTSPRLWTIHSLFLCQTEFSGQCAEVHHFSLEAVLMEQFEIPPCRSYA